MSEIGETGRVRLFPPAEGERPVSVGRPLVGIWSCLNVGVSPEAVRGAREQLSLIGVGHQDGSEILIDGVKWQWRTLPLVRYPTLRPEPQRPSPVKVTEGAGPWFFALLIVGPLAFLAGLIVGIAA